MPQPLVKGEAEIFIGETVELVGGVVSLVERQTGTDHLQADMILLVHHQAQALIFVEDQRPAFGVADKFRADQSAFYQ